MITLRSISRLLIMRLLLLLFLFFACERGQVAEEHEILQIPLASEINNPKAEVSGLDWFDDQLILMLENPESFSDMHWYSIEKKEIIDFIDSKSTTPIIPQKIKLYGDFSRILPSYEGFEAIAFSGDTLFAAIEMKNHGKMSARLVKGRINLADNRIIFDTLISAQVPIPDNLFNIAVESIVIIKNEIFLIYEANGRNISSSPQAYRFDKDLNYLGTASFPTIEYRITDATRIDVNNRFWAINYFYPGDSLLIPSGDDFIAPANRSKSRAVERLIQLEYSNGAFGIYNNHPVWLKKLPKDSRNWEGLARLDKRGFIIVNDEFPRNLGTILAFVKFPLEY